MENSRLKEKDGVNTVYPELVQEKKLRKERSDGSPRGKQIEAVVAEAVVQENEGEGEEKQQKSLKHVNPTIDNAEFLKNQAKGGAQSSPNHISKSESFKKSHRRSSIEQVTGIREELQEDEQRRLKLNHQVQSEGLDQNEFGKQGSVHLIPQQSRSSLAPTDKKTIIVEQEEESKAVNDRKKSIGGSHHGHTKSDLGHSLGKLERELEFKDEIDLMEKKKAKLSVDDQEQESPVQAIQEAEEQDSPRAVKELEKVLTKMHVAVNNSVDNLYPPQGQVAISAPVFASSVQQSTSAIDEADETTPTQ